MASQPLPGIDHVVLLMFENRSFDNIFGGYNALLEQVGSTARVNGLTGTESNPTSGSHPASVQVYQVNDPSEATTYPDPGELYWPSMTGQIYGFDGLGLPHDPATHAPTMDGFVIDYKDQPGVMAYFGQNVVAMTWLAGLMGAVCDTWHASAPTQTFANRVMSICATPGINGLKEARVDDPGYFPFLHYFDVTDSYGSVPDLSIFELLDLQYPDAATPNWKVYYHDTPLSSLVQYVNDQWDYTNPAQTASANVCHYDDSDYGALPAGYGTFANDVASGALPKFSIIEPRYFANWSPANLPPNSNHPGPAKSPIKNAGIDSSGSNNNGAISVDNGEALLLDVVLTLLENGAFSNTLLVVTYDEHGGMYDHVPPPTSVPEPFNQQPAPSLFLYDRLGVRVPAIFIGGGVAPGTVFEPAAGQPYPWFDHTSLIRTLREQFGLTTGPNGATITQLTPRDGSVSDLTGLFTMSAEDAEAARTALQPKLEALRSGVS